jgi:hypothetical protein
MDGMDTPYLVHGANPGWECIPAAQEMLTP